MAGVIHNYHKDTLIEEMRAFLNTCYLILFVNDFTPAEGDERADFDEPTDTGYVDTMTPGFEAATLNGANQGQLLGTARTWIFNHSGGNFTIYGYAICDPTTDEVVASERVASPFTVTAPNQTFTVRAKMLLDNP